MIDYKSELNKAQLEAVETTEGPVLVLAGAGSGKTRTLIYRVCHLLEKGVDPNAILLLTFTNKAAKEMQDRAKQMIGEKAEQITACTYHSFCTQMLRKYAYQAGILQEFTIISGDDPATIIHMMEAELGYEEIPGFPRSKQIAGIISDSINRELPIKTIVERFYPRIMEAGGFIKEIETLKEKSEAYKKANDLLDYDDLMVRFYQMLLDRPDVAEEIDDRFLYICVDEFQDTNPLQARILKALRKRHNNLMVVGDDYQAIYGFRGSDVRIIQSFPDEYPGTKLIFLTSNYRSTPEIVNFANRLMHDNVIDDRYKKSLVSENPHGVLPMLMKPKTQEKAATIIVNNIEKAHANGRKYGETMVLVRASSSFVTIEAELLSRGIPFEKRGGPKFFDQSHVRDALAFLRLYTNTKDELSWFRVVQLVRGIGEAQARQLAAELRENGICILYSYDGKPCGEGLKALGEFIESLGQKETVPEMMTAITNFYEQQKKAAVMARSIDTDTKKEEMAKIAHATSDLRLLVSLSEKYKSPLEMLDSLSFDAPQQPDVNSDGVDDKVVISTVHSSKGLEFDTVYILDCVDGMFPATDFRDVGSPEDQEELRCFYVAVTRAKRLLFLFTPAFCKTRRGVVKKYPAHYLDKTMDALKVLNQ